jgi:hypothetical protein
MEGSLWSGTEKAGVWPVLLSSDGKKSPMVPEGPPVVKELNPRDLGISQPLNGGGTFSVVCAETNLIFSGVDGQGLSLRWAWEMVGGAKQKAAVQTVTAEGIVYRSAGMNYQLRLAPGAGSCQQLDNGAVRLIPDTSGKLVLILCATARP